MTHSLTKQVRQRPDVAAVGTGKPRHFQEEGDQVVHLDCSVSLSTYNILISWRLTRIAATFIDSQPIPLP